MHYVKMGFSAARTVDRALWTAERTEHRLRRGYRAQKTIRGKLIGLAEKKEKDREEEEDPGPSGKLFLTVIEGRHLKIADVTGKSDPYVKVRCGRMKERTKVIRRNLNPVWDQQFEFDITYERYIVFKVKDSDRVTRDDEMGRGRLELAPLEGGEEVDEWVHLDTKGAIHIRAQFVLDDAGLKMSGARARSSVPDSRGVGLPSRGPSARDEVGDATGYSPQAAVMGIPPLPPGRRRMQPSVLPSSMTAGMGGASSTYAPQTTPIRPGFGDSPVYWCQSSVGPPLPQGRGLQRGESVLPGSMTSGMSASRRAQPPVQYEAGPRSTAAERCQMCGAPASVACLDCGVCFCIPHNAAQHQFGTTLSHRRVGVAYLGQNFGDGGVPSYL